MFKLNTTVDANGKPTALGTPVELSIMQAVVAGATMPIGAAAEPGDYVSHKLAGMATIGFATLGLLLGEAWGHKRAAAGGKALIPFLRPSELTATVTMD